MSGPISNRARSTSTHHAAAGALQWLARCILLSVVLAAPWFFGGVTSGVCYWLMTGVGIAFLVALAGRFLDGDKMGPLPLISIPLGLAIGFAILQIIPLPTGIARWLSPTAIELRSELNMDSEIVPLSLYPSATRGDLVLLTLGITVFALGFILFASRQASRLLLIGVSLNGLALACVGLVQEVASEPGTILGIPIASGGPFATFVNQNHAGGYLNLCLACAAGMLVWAWRRAGPQDIDPSITMPRHHSNLVHALADAVSRLNGNILFSLTIIIFLLAGIVCSLSRGAFVGMCVATLIATLVYRIRHGEHRALLGAVAIAAGIGLVAWLGLGEIVTDRLATLFDREAMAEHGLLEHWPVAAKIFPDYWLAGSGLGTYGYIYGPYLDGPIGPWFIRAENQYLEALIDGGIIGFLLLATSLILAWIATVTLVRRAVRTPDIALATAGIFAIGSQTVTAAFDFGLYAPANLMLLAILCGPVARRAIALTHPLRTLTWLRLPAWRFAPAMASVILLGALAYSSMDIRTAAWAESARLAAHWDRPVEVLEASELEQAIDNLSPIAEDRPGDANVQFELVELWTNLYRLRAVALLQAEAPADIDRSVLWNMTSPLVLHRQLHDLAAAKDRDSIDALTALRTEPIVSKHLEPAYRHLQRARFACPLLPRVHLRLAELCGLETDPDQDRVHIAHACQIAPGDPDVWFHAGVLDAQAGRNQKALNAWQRCLELSDQYVTIVLRVAEPVLEDTQLVDWLLPAKPKLLLHLARTRYAQAASDSDPRTIRNRLLARATALIEDAASNPDPDSDLDGPTRAHLLAAIYAEQGKTDEALAHYRAATTSRPFELEWQYEFAKLLIETGNLDKALELARRCTRLAPKNRRYRQLLEQIRTLQLRT